MEKRLTDLITQLDQNTEIWNAAEREYERRKEKSVTKAIDLEDKIVDVCGVHGDVADQIIDIAYSRDTAAGRAKQIIEKLETMSAK